MTPRHLRIASNLALSAAVGLGALGLWLARPVAPATARIEPAERSIGRVAVGQTIPVTFRVTNPSDRPVQVLGGYGPGVCLPAACFRWQNLPLEVPAGGSGEVRFLVEARHAGAVDFHWRLFTTADGASRNLNLKIRGEVVDPPKDS